MFSFSVCWSCVRCRSCSLGRCRRDRCRVSCSEVVCFSLGVEVNCLNCVAPGSEVGIVFDDVPVEVVACITFGVVAFTCLDVDIGCLDCIRVAVVDCLSDGDIGFSCLDVNIEYVDFIHIFDVDCVSDVVATLFCLDVDIRWLVCIQVGYAVCIYDVIVVPILVVICVANVHFVIELIDGHIIDGHAIFSADNLELDVDVNCEMYVVDSDVNE